MLPKHVEKYNFDMKIQFVHKMGHWAFHVQRYPRHSDLYYNGVLTLSGALQRMAVPIG